MRFKSSKFSLHRPLRLATVAMVRVFGFSRLTIGYHIREPRFVKDDQGARLCAMS